MAIQTAIEQTVAQATPHATPVEETLSTQSASLNQNQPQQGGRLTALLATGETEAAHITRAAATVPSSTIVFVATATLAAAALFGSGLLRSRVKPALRRLAVNAEDIRVPILLPVTLAEVAWELIADWRARPVAPAVSRRPTLQQTQ